MTNEELITELTYHANIEKRKLLSDAAYALEAAEKRIDGLQKLVDINTERCEALRKQLREANESYDKRIAELEAQLPKEVEWLELDKIKTYCSNCNWASYSMLVQKDAFLLRNNKTKFCPNCGARMKTVTDCHALEEENDEQ